MYRPNSFLNSSAILFWQVLLWQVLSFPKFYSSDFSLISFITLIINYSLSSAYSKIDLKCRYGFVLGFQAATLYVICPDRIFGFCYIFVLFHYLSQNYFLHFPYSKQRIYCLSETKNCFPLYREKSQQREIKYFFSRNSKVAYL